MPSRLGDTALVRSFAPALVARLDDDERKLVRDFAGNDTLNALALLALQHNPDVRSALRQAEAAREAYHLETGARLPAIAFQVTSNRTHFGNPDIEALSQENYSVAGIGVDYELDLFGRIRALSQAARERYLGSQYGVKAARAALITEVLRAYTVERAAAKTAALAQRLDGNQQKLLRFAKRQAELGLISRNEFDDAANAAVQTHTLQTQASHQHEAALRALQSLVGFASQPSADGEPGWLERSPPVPPWRNLDSTVLLQRPDVRQAEAELKARYADIGAARAAFFPSIQLTSSIGTVSEGLGSLFSAGTRAWTFNPRLTLPIFTGGRNDAQLKLANLRRDEGITLYEKTIQTAFREVADALENGETLAQLEAVHRQRAASLDKRAEATLRRAARDRQDPKDALLDENLALEAHIAHVEAARNAALNRILILHAFYGVLSPSQP